MCNILQKVYGLLLDRVRFYRVVQKRISSFIFEITSVIQHRAPIFTVASRNSSRVNVKFFHPPHLYCVTTLPSKTNTTADICVKYLHFSRNVMLSVGVSRTGKTWVVFNDPEAKVNSSYYCNIVFEKGLLPDVRRSEQYVVITGGHCSRMERQRTPPGPRWTI